MLQKGTRLRIIDNSGAKRVEITHIFGKGKNMVGTVGTLVSVTIKTLRKNVPTKKVEKGKVYLALIVSAKKSINRSIGTCLKAKTNAAVILNKDKVPLANRFVGSVNYEIRSLGYTKIASMARGII